MRVNIHFPNQESSSSSSSKIDLSHIPAPLVRLAPSNELVMIELQGSLEIDDPDPEGGQIIGRIEFYPGREDHPTLLISHHRLEGRLVNLIKPLAVLEKKQRVVGKDEEDLEGSNVMKDIDINKNSKLSTRKQKEKKIDDIPSSPLRFSTELNDNLTNTQITIPDSPTTSRRNHNLLTANDATRKPESLQIPPSSSPIPMKRMLGSELDFSSPLPASKRQAIEQNQAVGNSNSTNELDVQQAATKDGEAEEDDNDDEWLYKKGQTSTYMEVICIIRKKFLFSKRPEPVVRLDSDGIQEEK